MSTNVGTTSTPRINDSAQALVWSAAHYAKMIDALFIYSVDLVDLGAQNLVKQNSFCIKTDL